MVLNAYIKQICIFPLASCVVILMMLYMFPACDDDFSETITQENQYNDSNNPSSGNDDTHIPPPMPTPGNSGFIDSSLVPSGDVQLIWTKASDTLTEQSKLLYRAFYSLKSDIATVEGAETFGTPASGWAEDAASITISSLEEGKQYFFNIVVAAPDGRKAAYSMTSVTIPGTVYLYSAQGTYQGNLAELSSSARATIDAHCAPAMSMSVVVVPSFTHYHAFISITDTDAIKNFPALYNVPANWNIKSFSGGLIAYNWSDLLDGSINMKLEAAGAVDSFWWSGSFADGSFDEANSCSSWNDGSNKKSGRVGAHNAPGHEWLSGDTRNCNNALKLLCVGW